MPFAPGQQEKLASTTFDPEAVLAGSLNTQAPWESVVDFVTHPSFCGFPLFPKQVTLLRLTFLETDQMTAFDLDTIEDWRKGFTRHRDIYGVQPDIWQRVEYLRERGYRRFPHIQAVLGRRGAKGVLGGVLGTEQIAFLHSLDNPQAVYGIAEAKDVYLNVGATSQTVAMRQQFADVRTMVEQCKYFRPENRPTWIAESKDAILRVRTPADVRRIAELRTAKVPIDHQIATLCGVALSASSVAGRGPTSYGNIYDEFAFHVQTGSVKSDSEIYKDWQPSLGQFGIDALTFVPSSPWTKTGQFYTLYEQGKVLMSTYADETGMREEAKQQLVNSGHLMELDAEPTWLIYQGSSWSLYEDWQQTPKILGLGYTFAKPPEPNLSDERQIRERRRDPDKFRVEKMGQFAEVIGAYLDPDAVDRMFEEPGWREPLSPQSHGVFQRKYRIHCDPGRTGANFALAIGHIETAPCEYCGRPYEESAVGAITCTKGGYCRFWPHVVMDLSKVWRPMDYPEDPETHKQTIDYVQVHSDIEDIVGRFLSTEKISFDQWNSASFLSSLKQKFSPGIRVIEETFTDKVNQTRFEKFKSAVNLGWCHAYTDNFYMDNMSCLLELELKFLAEKNGKVIKQDVGPVVTKDLADAWMVVVVDLLHDALDRWSSEVMTAGAFGSTNTAGLRSGREQERMAEGLGKDNQAWRTLSVQKRDRARARLQGRGRVAYEPSRLTSIHKREPRMPK